MQPPVLLPGLTGLRGFTAIWVFWHHLTDPGRPSLSVGYLGVDLFFLVSGFVLSHVYAGQGWTGGSYLRFLAARLARIYPLHVATLAAVVGLVLIWPGFAETYRDPERRFAADALLAHLLLVQNWAFVHPMSWNAPAWSLSAEWAAYLALPLFLWVASRAPRPLWLAFGCAVALAAALWAWGAAASATGTPGMLRLGFGFLAGCLLHVAWSRGARIPVGLATAAALLALALGHVPGWASVATFGFPAVVLLCARGEGAFARLCATAPALWLGEISFSLYLWHWPMIQVANRLPGVDLGQPAWTLALLAAALAVATLSHRLVERPARAWGRRIANAAVARRQGRDTAAAPA